MKNDSCWKKTHTLLKNPFDKKNLAKNKNSKQKQQHKTK